MAGALTATPRRARTHLVARLAAAVGVAVLAFGLAACSAEKPPVVPSDDGAKVSVTVRVIDNKFEPSDITIQQGQAVNWVFEGASSEHDVVAKDGSFVSELMMEGSYTHVFDEPGAFDYLCSIHPEMRGLVTVE
ncbi:MAG: cupredoxin domain-containing protein [Leucobacter sp.]|nr:cupredoxin domain-containing protein [Leucobacter sp.]